MNRHKKMAGLLKTAQDGSLNKDDRMEQLDGKLKNRVDNKVTLGESITKVVKAIFGKQLFTLSVCLRNSRSLFVILMCLLYFLRFRGPNNG